MIYTGNTKSSIVKDKSLFMEMQMMGEIMMIVSGILSCIFGSILVVLGIKKKNNKD